MGPSRLQSLSPVIPSRYNAPAQPPVEAPPAYTPMGAPVRSTIAAPQSPLEPPPSASALPYPRRPAGPGPLEDEGNIAFLHADPEDPEAVARAFAAYQAEVGDDFTGHEDVLLAMALSCDDDDLRKEAVARLGALPTVRAVDALLELFWHGDAVARAEASFQLSPGTAQMLAFESRDDAASVSRCLRDLILYAPSTGSVPADALMLLQGRVEDDRPGVGQLLCDVAARSPDAIARDALTALERAVSTRSPLWARFLPALEQACRPDVLLAVSDLQRRRAARP
jgi:hypothetical protein